MNNNSVKIPIYVYICISICVRLSVSEILYSVDPLLSQHSKLQYWISSLHTILFVEYIYINYKYSQIIIIVIIIIIIIIFIIDYYSINVIYLLLFFYLFYVSILLN